MRDVLFEVGRLLSAPFLHHIPSAEVRMSPIENRSRRHEYIPNVSTREPSGSVALTGWQILPSGALSY